MNKINYQPYYNELYNKYGLEHIQQAGYFEQTETIIDWHKEVEKPCTPISFLKDFNNQTKNCVIISTGSFAPLHVGHINCMINAKNILEQDGWNVMGGYLSPGHDEYINQKLGSNAISIGERLMYATSLIKDYTWLSMDPWEGVFAPCAVNFTSVVYRLKLYLTKWISSDIKIFYVCGTDNGTFGDAFELTNDVGSVSCMRPGYINNSKHKDELTYFVEDNQINTSSTEVRNSGFKIDLPKQVYLRLNNNQIENQIKHIVTDYFKHVWPVYIDKQKQAFDVSIKHLHNIINLDKESNDLFDYNLDISRIYDLFGQYKLGYNYNHIQDKIKTIPNKIKKEGVYLFDDDIYTGNTMLFVEKELNKQNIKVLGKLSYMTGNKYVEILDVKDLILGYKNGGLLIKLRNKTYRMPYVYPFVCPTSRASIKDGLQFSKDVWKFNMDLYKNKDTTLKDVNLDLYVFGFESHNKLYDVAKHYYDML